MAAPKEADSKVAAPRLDSERVNGSDTRPGMARQSFGGAESLAEARTAFTFDLNHIRGLCILAVVVLHVHTGFFDREGPGWILFCNLCVNMCTRFAVPIFFGLSAFYLCLNPKNHLAPKKLYGTRLRYLVATYVLYTVLYSVVLNRRSATPIAVVLTNIALGTGALHLWFMYALVQFYLLHPFLYRAYIKLRARVPTLALWAILLQITWSVVVSFAADRSAGRPWGDALRALNHTVIAAVGFIALGYELHARADLVLAVIRRRFTALSALALAFGSCLLVAWWWLISIRLDGASLQSARFTIPVVVLSAVLGVAVFVAFEHWMQLGGRRGAVGRALNSFGLYSYGIYYVHILVLFVANSLNLHLLHLRPESLTFGLVLLFSVPVLSLWSAKVLARLPFNRYLT